MKISLEVYYAGKELCEKGYSFGPAVRPHYLLHFILDGKGIYEVHGKSYPLQKGQAFLIKPGETTCYTADACSPWTYAWIGFGGTGVPEMLQRCDFVEQSYIYNGIDPSCHFWTRLSICFPILIRHIWSYLAMYIFYSPK